MRSPTAAYWRFKDSNRVWWEVTADTKGNTLYMTLVNVDGISLTTPTTVWEKEVPWKKFPQDESPMLERILGLYLEDMNSLVNSWTKSIKNTEET